MWTAKTKVIPLIPGANGIFSKSFRKCLRNILGRRGHQGTTYNSNIEHRTQSLESSNAKVQKTQHGK